MAGTYSIEYCTKMIIDAAGYAEETKDFDALWRWIGRLEKAIEEENKPVEIVLEKGQTKVKDGVWKTTRTLKTNPSDWLVGEPE